MQNSSNSGADADILVRHDGAVATVVLNRPDKLNAITKAMWRRLGEVMAELDGIEQLRCVILRGAGEEAFAPGADIGEFAQVRRDSAQAVEYGAVMHGALRSIRDCRHPVIAEIHGVCIGGGLELASMCDLRICGASSRFGIPVNRLGLVMAYPEIEALVALTGPAVAPEMLLEARLFDAREAKDKGLVNRVVADGAVAAEVEKSAARIAEGAPLVNRWHKKFINRVVRGGVLRAEEEAEGFACFDTEDYKTGVAAFLEKRKPAFEGK